MGLKRKNFIESPIEEVIHAILREIDTSGRCLGYKTLWRRLQSTYHLKVKRETVLDLQRLADPDGVAARRKKRFIRRRYVVPGPNFLWHLDGYDKMKPFGFAIHGAIDGYSRRILWLNVSTTNNNPRVVANYFLNNIKKLKVVPTLLRTDLGTENMYVGLLQTYFRYFHADTLARQKSFIQGKSTSNQRIECWWSQMRRLGGNWWINYFKDLRDRGLYNDGDLLHVECLRFCYGALLQCELQTILEEWNQHRIRKQKITELPAGKPNVLYFLPETVGSKDYGKREEITEVETCLNLYSVKSELYNPLFGNLVELLLPGTNYPSNANEAFNLFTNLLKLFSLYDDYDDNLNIQTCK